MGSESPGPGWNNVACKGHSSSLTLQAVGNILHQGWIKLLLKLNPGPSPTEQQSRAWGCPGCPRGRDRDWKGSSYPLIWVLSPPVLRAPATTTRRAGKGTDLMISSYLSRW